MVINTDSHQKEQLRFIKFGIAQARRGWAGKKDIINSFAKAINNLLPKYRKVLLLRHNGDLTFREISESLNEPLNTIKSRYRRGLAMLKKFLVS